jgi:hypothetical protein
MLFFSMVPGARRQGLSADSQEAAYDLTAYLLEKK